MICLVFTKTKLLAGISLKSPDLLSIKGNAFVEYGEKSMTDSLKLHLPDIKQAYASYARKNGMQPEVTIPVAVAFPDDIQGNNAQEQEANSVLEFIDKDKKSFQLLHKDLLGTSFLHSVSPDPEVRKSPVILLNALDNHLDLYYLNTNGKFNGNTYVELKEIGIERGQQNLLKELTSEFKKAGIQLDEKDLKHIETLVKNPPPNYIFELKKASGPVRIKAELALTPRRYDEIITINRNSLGSRLNQNNLRAQGISKVVLMGEFLGNSVWKDYFNKELQIGPKLLTLDTRASAADYKAIVRGLAARTQEVVEAERKRKEEEARKKKEEAERKRKEEAERKRKEEAERKRKEEEARKKKEEAERKRKEEEARKRREEEERKRKEEEERKRKAMLEAERKRKEEERKRKEEEERRRKAEEERRRKAEEERKRLEAEKKAKLERDAFIRTVQTNCTDPSKEAEYIERYSKEGAKFNIPKEVISWTIKEALNNLKLHGQQVSQPNVPVAAAPVATPPADKNLMRLYDLFDVEAVLIDSEFSTKKVVQIDSGTKKIIRIIDRASMSNPVQMENFKKLYKKELKYYKALSEIHTVQEGMYYSRDFIDSVSLKDYIRKIGLDKKTRVEQLKSADLKLLLQVFREVNTLEVSHASLDDDNIQIIESRKWNLQRDIDIKFSGFTSIDATQEEMEQKLHQLFGKLLEEKVYADFREKFNI